MQSAFIRKHSSFGSAQRVFCRVLLAIFACAQLFQGCTAIPVKEISREERAQLDRKLGMSLAPRFEAMRTFRKDEEVLHYLAEMAKALARPFKELQEAPLHVLVIKDTGGRWKNYSLPGNSVYLSGSLLSLLRFENEVAAVLALELGNLTRRNVALRFQVIVEPADPLEEEAVFEFSDDARIGGLQDSMEMLYQAGFDPRGMVSLLTRFKENPARSPYPAETVSKMIENTRRIIALQAPLRNPIVRSGKFLAIAKRMQKL